MLEMGEEIRSVCLSYLWLEQEAYTGRRHVLRAILCPLQNRWQPLLQLHLGSVPCDPWSAHCGLNHLDEEALVSLPFPIFPFPQSFSPTFPDSPFLMLSPFCSVAPIKTSCE